MLAAKMAKRSGEWVYDELLSFLANPFFQIPVVTFMEANCISFYGYSKLEVMNKEIWRKWLFGNGGVGNVLTYKTVVRKSDGLSPISDRAVDQGKKIEKEKSKDRRNLGLTKHGVAADFTTE
ncbi:hypothetical protein KUTeg_013905 [Tegillarca granosa]|uniref:BART domain-containing protein n=1 Tax=Tegillarca granosa TaxID=220873 RepID=A0ABQ9EXI5_TEGGR|nr:hypothetical protein KUTeg_013905 [Tegillarca granosa]